MARQWEEMADLQAADLKKRAMDAVAAVEK
jgi:hypothetical protein